MSPKRLEFVSNLSETISSMSLNDPKEKNGLPRMLMVSDCPSWSESSFSSSGDWSHGSSFGSSPKSVCSIGVSSSSSSGGHPHHYYYGKPAAGRRHNGGNNNNTKSRKKTGTYSSPPRHPLAEKSLSLEECRRYVAMDCEMVGTGQDGRTSSVARVTLIDWYGGILLDELVRQSRQVTDYRTFVSGITPEMMEHARTDLTTCRARVLELLQGKILVGHGLKNDLRALGITHPWYNLRDTAKYEPFMKTRFQDGVLWPRALKDLVKEKLGRDIQVCGKAHCPYEDAFAALSLYRLVRPKWEKAMSYKFKKTREIQEMQSP